MLPLLKFASEGDTELMQRELERGENVNLQDENGRTALMYASSTGFTGNVEILLQYNANVNLRENKNGWTALHIASIFGYTGVFELLIKHNAVVNLEDKNGWTALAFASRFGHIEILRMILQSNNDFNVDIVFPMYQHIKRRT